MVEVPIFVKHFFYLGSQIFNLPLDLYVVGLRRKLASFCLQASLYAMFISTVIFIASLLFRRLGHPRYQALWYFIQLAHFLFELFIYSPVYFIFFSLSNDNSLNAYQNRICGQIHFCSSPFCFKTSDTESTARFPKRTPRLTVDACSNK